jgi:hypothetical protein
MAPVMVTVSALAMSWVVPNAIKAEVAMAIRCSLCLFSMLRISCD